LIWTYLGVIPTITAPLAHAHQKKRKCASCTSITLPPAYSRCFGRDLRSRSMMGLQQLTGIVLQFEKPSVLLGRTWDWIPNVTPLTWFGAHPLILTVVEALVMPSSEGCAAVPQRHRRGALSGPSRLPHGLWLGPRRDRGHLVAREAGVRSQSSVLGSGEPFPGMVQRRWSHARPTYPPLSSHASERPWSTSQV